MTLQELCIFQGINPENLSAKDLRELKFTFSRRDEMWANMKLHKKFGFTCDSPWCGFCGYHSAAEIAEAKAATRED